MVSDASASDSMIPASGIRKDLDYMMKCVEKRIEELQEYHSDQLESLENMRNNAMQTNDDIAQARNDIQNIKNLLAESAKNNTASAVSSFAQTHGTPINQEQHNTDIINKVYELRELARVHVQCYLCQDIITSPVLLIGCGHYFCHDCIMAHKKKFSPFTRFHLCPKCDKSGKILPPRPTSTFALLEIYSVVEELVRAVARSYT